MFLQTYVKNSVNGGCVYPSMHWTGCVCVSSMHWAGDGRHPPPADTPWADTSLQQTPLGQTPPGRDPQADTLLGKHPLPPQRPLQRTVRILLE